MPEDMESRAEIVTLKSPADFRRTLAHLREALLDAGATIFAMIDHAAAARSADLTMPETTVLVFGNPRRGTGLMLRHPDLALDMPYRVLVREREGAGVEVLFHSAAAMEERHGMGEGEGEARVFHHLEELLRGAVSGSAGVGESASEGGRERE